MTSTTATNRVNQQQIADLAGVRRPVVTMWRKRFATGHGAFPPPRGNAGKTLLFDVEEVRGWLQQSRHIDPATLEDSAAASRRPPALGSEDLHLAHRLLGAVVLAGSDDLELADPDDPDEILDIVWGADPDDTMLASEIMDSTDAEIVQTLRWVQDIRRGSLGPSDAWSHIEDAAARFGTAPALVRITADVRRVVEALAVAVAREVSPGNPTLFVRRGGTDLVAALDEDEPVTWTVTADPTEEDADEQRGALRLARVRQHLSGAEMRPADEVEPQFTVGIDAVLPGSSDTPLSDLMDSLAELVDDPSGPRFSVTLGPAALLTDHLPESGPDYGARLHLARQGFVRAAVRLGRGGLVDTPAQHLALWVVGPSLDMTSLETAQVRVGTADISGTDIGAVTDDLVADLLAALRDRPAVVDDDPEDRTHAHLMQVMRHELLSDLLAEDRTEIVRRGAQPNVTQPDSSAAFDEALEAASQTLPGIPDPRVPPAVGSAGALRRTVQELLEKKRLALISGSRLPADLPAADSRAALAIIGPKELADRSLIGTRTVTLFDLVKQRVRVHRTEPGDIVFGGTPTIAWVDVEGGNVLQSPVRALRVLPGEDDVARLQEIVPHVLAADVAGTQGNIRAAHVRLLPLDQAARLTTFLNETERARRETLRRAAALARLPDLLADGIVAGTFDLTDTTQPGD